jgi:enoyl-CoA hydratase/carnithine racemase
VALVLQTLDSDGVAILTLNDPPNLNAMSDEMATEFSAVVGSLKMSKGLRAVILTGAGKAFSAGGHLSMLEAKQRKASEENRQGMLTFYNSFLCMRELNVPLIAAINGAAVGAGLCVACACDFRVASDTTKLGFTFLKLGLHPGMGATYFVPRIVGASVATELFLTGRVISAQEALRIGVVSRVCPSTDVMKEAQAIAAEVLSCGSEATAQLLQTMRGDPELLARALDREASCQSVNYASDEFAEGVVAIKEKRSPSFSKR